MKYIAGHEKLLAWQKADELVFMVYKETQDFPKSELFALTSQLRRAALSVPTNIVEGYARNSKTEFKRYLVIALGSLAEARYLLSVSLRLRYITEPRHSSLTNVAESCGQLLWKLYKSL